MTTEEKKETKRLYDIEYRKKNKDILNKQKKQWATNNKDKVQECRDNRKDKKRIEDRNYAIANKDKLNNKKKQWAKDNPEKKTKANSKYVKNKLATDPLYKLKHNISCGIRMSIIKRGYTKKSRSYEILGCSFEEFKQHIESKWEDWMNWDNYGNPKDGIIEPNKSWDIDHITPISSAINEGEVISLNHFTNLQPLCSYYNRWVKKDNII